MKVSFQVTATPIPPPPPPPLPPRSPPPPSYYLLLATTVAAAAATATTTVVLTYTIVVNYCGYDHFSTIYFFDSDNLGFY